VAVVVVDVDDVASGPVEQAGGDGGAESAGAVHPEPAVREFVHPRKQRVQREVGRAGDEAVGSFIVAAHVQDDVVGVEGFDLGERLPRVPLAGLPGGGELVERSGRGAGEMVDADPDELALGGSDLVG